MTIKRKDRYMYPAVLTYEDGQEIAVEFPDLGCATCGSDEEEAMKNARECLGIMMQGLEEDEEDIPKPTPLNAVKVDSNQRAVLVDVYMPAIRLSAEMRAVSRTVTLPAWMNAAAKERNINFSQVLQESLKKMLDC